MATTAQIPPYRRPAGDKARENGAKIIVCDPRRVETGRVQINSADAARLGIADRLLVWVSSRRGKVMTRADISDRINQGAVYMTYQWWVGACKELTQDNLDPISKTPETKYCPVKIEPIADQRWSEQFAWRAYSDMKARLKAAANA
ncbi:molybdopterin dinucleotide binding protein [Raoultella sp. BIGb0138]|nr:molybdopterin dinucleotide binding protein [Raoultella sp. BIGb0138]